MSVFRKSPTSLSSNITLITIAVTAEKVQPTVDTVFGGKLPLCIPTGKKIPKATAAFICNDFRLYIVENGG